MTIKHKRLDPFYPGEILLEEFMWPKGISINHLARDVVVPPGRNSTIVNGKRTITADTALCLVKYFGISPQTLMELQAEYELHIARRTIGDEVERRIQRQTT